MVAYFKTSLEDTDFSLELFLGGPMNLFGRKIRFLCDNYVLESDDLLGLAQQEFDTILCLSTTKWIHLNFGDDGIKRAFKRMFAQLRPGSEHNFCQWLSSLVPFRSWHLSRIR